MLKFKRVKIKEGILTDKRRSLNHNSLGYQRSLDQLLVAMTVKLDSP